MTDVLEILQLLPPKCASINPVTGDPILIARGVIGYYPAPRGLNVDAYSASHGVTPPPRYARAAASPSACAMARCLAWYATAGPRPPSPSSKAVVGPSLIVWHRARGFIRPLLRPGTYALWEERCAIPWESIPRRSVSMRTSAEILASREVMPHRVSISRVNLLRSSAWYRGEVSMLWFEGVGAALFQTCRGQLSLGFSAF